MRSTLHRIVLVTVAAAAFTAVGSSPGHAADTLFDPPPTDHPIPWVRDAVNPFPWIPTDRTPT